MTDSVLVRIPVDPVTGLLEDLQTSWRIGETQDGKKGISGLHNVSLSFKYPGCIWLSLQYANTLLLVDVTSGELVIKQVLQVPTQLSAGKVIGGPHVIREDPTGNGDIWVGLKGDIGCCPNMPKETANDQNAAQEAVQQLLLGNNNSNLLISNAAAIARRQRFKHRLLQSNPKFLQAVERECCSELWVRYRLQQHDALPAYSAECLCSLACQP